MPYLKKRVRKYRRKSRFRRKRFFRSSKKRYDGDIYHKIHYFKNVTNLAADVTNAPLVVSWGRRNPGGDESPVANYCYFNDSPEYADLKNNRRDIRIYGLKMIWRPWGDSSGGTVGYTVQSAQVASAAGNPEFTPTTITTAMMLQPDFKGFKPDASCKKYINVGKYFRNRGVKWLNIQDGD